MSQSQLLKMVAEALGCAGVPYMVTGSVVSSLQGEPRSTHDIDLVIAVEPEAAGRLVEAFPPPRFYLDEDRAKDAITKHEMFNLIDTESGDNVDFWPLTDEPFDRSGFGRRYEEEVAGAKIAVSSPEDTIMAKLRWARQAGGSEKQFVDALRIYEVQYERLGLDYLKQWADELGVLQEYARIREEAEII